MLPAVSDVPRHSTLLFSQQAVYDIILVERCYEVVMGKPVGDLAMLKSLY